MQITIQTSKGKKYIIPIQIDEEIENLEYIANRIKDSAETVFSFDTIRELMGKRRHFSDYDFSIDWEIRETEDLLGNAALLFIKLKTLKKEMLRYKSAMKRPWGQ